jgi:arabinofuranosyltransferase
VNGHIWRRAESWGHDLAVALSVAVPLALFLARERQIAGVAGFPLDDSWIHLHFARNLAEGAGFAYNPGVPVAGSTAPLWTLLLAAASAALGPSLLTTKALGLAAAVGAAVLTRRAAVAWGAPPLAALAAAVALACSGPLVWGALSGMEVTLAAALVAAALVAHAHDRTAWSALASALAVLARPEALVLVPLLLVARPVDGRRLAVFALITTAVLAPAVWFSVATVGSPVPATVAAKVEGGLLGWLAGVREPWWQMLVARPWQFGRAWLYWLASINWLLPLALIPGVWFAWTRHGRALGVLTIALVVHPLAMAWLAPYRDPAFQEGRYSIQLLPLVFLLAAAGVGSLAWRRAASVALLVLALPPLGGAADRYAWGVQNINAMQVHLGRWVQAHVPPTSRIALNDIGAIAYFSRRPVIDLMGLVTPDIVPYRRDGESGVIRYVTAHCPDYVIVFPAWFPQLTARTGALDPIYRVRLERNEVAGAAEMVVYRVTRCNDLTWGAPGPPSPHALVTPRGTRGAPRIRATFGGGTLRSSRLKDAERRMLA